MVSAAFWLHAQGARILCDLLSSTQLLQTLLRAGTDNLFSVTNAFVTIW